MTSTSGSTHGDAEPAHGPFAGFLSVYPLPPNQAVTVVSQQRINARRRQRRPAMACAGRVTQGRRSCSRTSMTSARAARGRPGWRTSAPSQQQPRRGRRIECTWSSRPTRLDVVDYATDNWLRAWFLGIDAGTVPVTMVRRVTEWRAFVTDVLTECARRLVPGGLVAFEVGVRGGGVMRLEQEVIPCGVAAGLEPVAVLINEQRFTRRRTSGASPTTGAGPTPIAWSSWRPTKDRASGATQPSLP